MVMEANQRIDAEAAAKQTKVPDTNGTARQGCAQTVDVAVGAAFLKRMSIGGRLTWKRG